MGIRGGSVLVPGRPFKWNDAEVVASCRKTTLESPDDFATLAHDRKVSPVADLFDLDAEECLQYLHETPVAEETWME